MTQRVKITKRLLDGLESAPFTVNDVDVQGFRARRQTDGGSVTFEARYRVAGRDRLLKLGKWGGVTIEQARDLARKHLGSVADGGDPQRDKVAKRLADASTISLADAVALYLEHGPTDKPNKRASTWASDATAFNRHLVPLLGKRRLDDLNATDLAKWQSDVAAGKTATREKMGVRGLARVTGGKGAAQRALLAVSAMLAWCVKRKFLASNPAVDVARYQSGGKDRYLAEDEGVRLWQAVTDLEAEKAILPAHGLIFRLLALTGARRGEIVELRWGEVDLRRGLLLLPPARHKTGGASLPKAISLNASAVALIAHWPRMTGAGTGQDWLFPKADNSGPIEPPKRAWGKVVARADLAGLRMHDLRHTFASWAIGRGEGLPVIAKLLGHANVASTARYAHLQISAGAVTSEAVANIYQAGNSVSDLILPAANLAKAAKVGGR
jgi:integrase